MRIHLMSLLNIVSTIAGRNGCDDPTKKHQISRRLSENSESVRYLFRYYRYEASNIKPTTARDSTEEIWSCKKEGIFFLSDSKKLKLLIGNCA